jgi:hypothetical protein
MSVWYTQIDFKFDDQMRVIDAQDGAPVRRWWVDKRSSVQRICIPRAVEDP